MTPRNTQLGASASARSHSGGRRASAPSARTSTRTATSQRPRAKASERERSRKDASWFRWWLLPVFVIAAIAIFVVTYYPVACVQYRETRQRSQLQAEYDSLQARNQRLATEVARLKTPEGVEDYARSQLGLVKQGEHVVVVTDATKPQAPATDTADFTPELDTSGETTTGPTGPWTRFLDAVFRVQ